MRRGAVLVAIAFLGNVGCPSAATPPTNGAAAAPSASAREDPGAADAGARVIGVEDDGKSFDVVLGSVITFALAGHAGTGYGWVPTHVDSNALAQIGDRTAEIDSDAPGGNKRDVYRFLAKAAGGTAVEMSLKRPFGDGHVARTIHVSIVVH